MNEIYNPLTMVVRKHLNLNFLLVFPHLSYFKRIYLLRSGST